MASHPHSDQRPRIVRATALPERSRASRDDMAASPDTCSRRLRTRSAVRAQWPFDDAERFNWHYVPRERAGVPIEAMGAAAKAAVHDLLRHALSEVGYRKATDIMALEEPLGLIENHARHYRHPENYSVTIFGEPGRLPWGWRIEGHHLSLNFTAVTEELFGVTPAFFGANPAKVPDGYPMAGHRALGRETDLSYELVRSLSADARERAIIARTSLGNIITEPGREDALKERQGLPLAAMDGRLPQPRARAARRLRQEPPPRLGRRRARSHPPGGRRAMPLRLGWAARAGSRQLLAPARADQPDRVRQHPEQRQPHPQRLARPRAQLRPRPSPPALRSRRPSPRPRLRRPGGIFQAAKAPGSAAAAIRFRGLSCRRRAREIGDPGRQDAG